MWTSLDYWGPRNLNHPMSITTKQNCCKTTRIGEQTQEKWAALMEMPGEKHIEKPCDSVQSNCPYQHKKTCVGCMPHFTLQSHPFFLAPSTSQVADEQPDRSSKHGDRTNDHPVWRSVSEELLKPTIWAQVEILCQIWGHKIEELVRTS